MQFPVPRRYCVAFSGGVDSHVLLHALVQLRDRLPSSQLHAIHINHGIHPDAGQWARHCSLVCQDLNVSFETHGVDVSRQAGHSLEASAREARYAAFAHTLRDSDMLLLAHHQDDQAETLLLQLIRGSGVKGLAAMPALTRFAQGWLGRPLLRHTRAQLHQYAVEAHLPWIEDPSNMDTAFDRNFLRHTVLPMLHQRWPALDATLARAAQHQADAAELLDEMALLDLPGIADTDTARMNIEALRQLTPRRQRNVLRYWLHRICALPLPDTVHLQRILDEMLPAEDDAMPMVHWPGAEVRRYREHLYAMQPLQTHDSNWQTHWDLQTELALPSNEVLGAHQMTGQGLRKTELTNGVTVRYRLGGERCQLPGREHHHELKKLFQSWSIPPWQRDRIPLVYIGEQLAQVVGFCVCAPFAARPGEMGVQIVTKPQRSAIETTAENKDNSPGCTP